MVKLNYTPRIDHSKKDLEVGDDMTQDKKLVKKAFKMHDEQEHEGEKTDLSKLKKGGRVKKEKGTVREFCGGGMTGKYKEGGLIKATEPTKKASGKPSAQSPDKFKKGGKC